MAFQTGTTTSIENLMTQLSTFLQANGWTEDYFNSGDPGSIAFSKNQNFVSFQFSDTAESNLGTMAIYQARANDASPTTEPWTATGDSGAGINTTARDSFDSGLCCNAFAGPHTNYWFFEQDSGPAYVHVVVEIDAGRFKHFGFGQIDKIGDWVGGEYIYGIKIFQGGQSMDPNSAFSNYGLDSSNAQINVGTGPATMRVDGHSGEPSVNTVWAEFKAGNAGLDRAGNARWKGVHGWRSSPEFGAFYWLRISEATAFKPLFPISLAVQDFSGTPDSLFRLGFQPDVRMCNIANISPAQIINIGGDDWYFFPVIRKQRLQVSTEESWNWGVAYKRVNA
jgi:hypothetical protein